LIESARALGKASPKAQKAIESMHAMASNAGLDGALFGRFATGIAVNNVDSAVHVAHLVTVHPLFSVTDFFSVQDLLKTGQGEDRGGSHINAAELTSGLFYGYVVVDVGQLDQNFADLNEQQRAGIAGWLVRAVAQVEPAAKLGSTAPYSGLRELMVEIGRRQPRSLIGAFERPVDATQDRTLSEEARHRLEAHATEMDALMGAPEYRSTLRQHAKGPLPAVEAISEEAAEKLATLVA
jgi:CRISPR system Cascade subunit CasC